MLTHVMVDTEALVSGGWPHPSADLENLVASCQALGIPVLLSSVTVTEAETIWIERNGDKVAKAKALLESLQRDFEGLVPQVIVPTADSLREAYRRAVDDVQRRWQWQVVAPPPMTAAEVVELSASHQPPFRGTDTGFRDSYIAMSAVIAAGRGSELGIVTADNALGNSAPLASFARTKDVTVRRFRTAADALQTIEHEGQNVALQAVIDQISERSARLMEALRADRERIAAFVLRNLEVPHDVGGPLMGRVQAVRGIEIGDVTEAHAGLLGEEQMRASATVALNMELEFRTYAWRGPAGLKQGERDEGPFGSTGTASGPRITVTILPGAATLDLLLTWPEDEHALPSIEYVGVEYGNASDAMTRKFTRLLLERS